VPLALRTRSGSSSSTLALERLLCLLTCALCLLPNFGVPQRPTPAQATDDESPLAQGARGRLGRCSEGSTIPRRLRALTPRSAAPSGDAGPSRHRSLGPNLAPRVSRRMPAVRAVLALQSRGSSSRIPIGVADLVDAESVLDRVEVGHLHRDIHTAVFARPVEGV